MFSLKKQISDNKSTLNQCLSVYLFTFDMLLYYLQIYALFCIQYACQNRVCLFQVIFCSVYPFSMASDYIAGTHSMAFVTVPNEELGRKLARLP